MYSVTKEKGGVLVRLSAQIGDAFVDSVDTLKPNARWFGKRAGDLEEGFYDLEGNFLSSFADWKFEEE